MHIKMQRSAFKTKKIELQIPKSRKIENHENFKKKMIEIKKSVESCQKLWKTARYMCVTFDLSIYLYIGPHFLDHAVT